jgi:hypothetical protein
MVAVADDKADVVRWRAFAAATGWHDSEAWASRPARLTTTARCAAVVGGAAPGALWAWTVSQLELMPLQAARLFARYGLDPGGAVWFDHRPAAHRGLDLIEADLERAAHHDDPFPLLRAAQEGFVAIGELFDGLQAARTARTDERGAA